MRGSEGNVSRVIRGGRGNDLFFHQAHSDFLGNWNRREDGQPLHKARRAAANVLSPFEISRRTISEM